MTGMMLPIRWDWPKLFSYGEVICFVSAWAIGIVLAWDRPQAPETPRDSMRAFASFSDSPGIQASVGSFTRR